MKGNKGPLGLFVLVQDFLKFINFNFIYYTWNEITHYQKYETLES